jgi:hypothetical protein
LTIFFAIFHLIYFQGEKIMQNAVQSNEITNNEEQSAQADYMGYLANLTRDELYNILVRILDEQQTAAGVIKKFIDQTDSTAAGSEMPIQSTDNEINRRISNIFITIGLPPHIKGYQYLRCAIKICIKKTEIISFITKCLYPDVAKEFGTTPSKVERAIRHAIEVCWNRGKIDAINNFFGSAIFTKYDRPTNGEFIALIADKLLLEGV